MEPPQAHQVMLVQMDQMGIQAPQVIQDHQVMLEQ
jgi:hypothetical protein